MKRKEIKLIKNLSKLVKQLNHREYLHHFGPKKFKLVHHLLSLLLKESLKCSFRRISWLLNEFEIKVPTYSALCKSRKRIPASLWNSLLKLTAGDDHRIVAIDSTGFSRTNPSHHYIKRIDRKQPVKRYTKLSALFDIIKKKFTALRIRIKPRHDMKDVNYLLKQSSPSEKLIGDSAYDAESLHEYCYWKNIKAVIKPRKYSKKGWARKKHLETYSDEEYSPRSLIESGFGSVKRKYGGYVSGKNYRSIKAEYIVRR